jgi:hypothetical protein
MLFKEFNDYMFFQVSLIQIFTLILVIEQLRNGYELIARVESMENWRRIELFLLYLNGVNDHF